MEINDSPKPKFDTDEERTYFLVELQINKYFNEYINIADIENNSELSNDQIKVLEYIVLHGEISNSICREKLKFGKTKSLEIFKQLIALNKIKRIGNGLICSLYSRQLK